MTSSQDPQQITSDPLLGHILRFSMNMNIWGDTNQLSTDGKGEKT